MNMKTSAGFLWVVLIGLWSSGCAGVQTPQEVCEDRCAWSIDHCGGSASVDCSSLCTSLRSKFEHLGCGAEMDAMELCSSEQSQCDTTNVCASQNTALVVCMSASCMAHPDDTNCGNTAP